MDLGLRPWRAIPRAGVAAQRRGAARVLCGLVLLLAACTPSSPAAPAPTRTLAQTATGAAAPTATRTALPSRTPAPPPTATPTATPTAPPVGVGTPLPQLSGPIIEAALPKIRLLAQWGRGRVEGLAWSPDGARLAVATALGVYLYTGDRLDAPLLVPTGAPAYRLAWSADGQRLLVDTQASDGARTAAVPPHRVQLWDLAQPQPRPVALFETGALALDLAFDGAEEMVVLGRADDGAVFQRWSLPGLKLTQQVRLAAKEDGAAAAGALSADRRLAATHGQAGPVRIWRLADGANLSATRAGDGSAGALAFSPDGAQLAVAYPDETIDFLNSNRVRVWPVHSGEQELTEPVFTLGDASLAEGKDEAWISLAWSPDGQYLAAGGADQQIHIWRAGAGPVYRRIAAQTQPRFLAFLPGSSEAGLKLSAGGLEIFQVADGQRTALDEGYLPAIYDMRFSPDGSALVLAEFGRIDFRASFDGRSSHTITNLDGPVHAIAFDPQSNYLVAACQDGTTRLYRARDGLYLDQLGEPGLPVLSADFSSNGFWIASAGEDMKMRIFRLDDGAQILTLSEPYVAYQLLFAPNNDQMAALTTTGVHLRAIDGSERSVRLTLEGTVGGVGLTDMAYSPGSEYLALVGNEVVRVINPATREDVYTLHEPGGALPWSVTFSPDNAFLAVGWSDGQIHLYWAQDGTLMRAWQAHPESVLRLAFTRDGQMLASLGAEATIRTWGVAP